MFVLIFSSGKNQKVFASSSTAAPKTGLVEDR
jgi:hypothetical protein